MKFKLILLLVLIGSLSHAQTLQDTVRMMIAQSIRDLKIAPESVAAVKDDFVLSDKDSIGIRIYRPALNKKLPVVYLVHGGGWVAGDLDTHDNVCRHLANKLQAIVVAVNYRRPPEYKFPVPFDDAYLVLKWIHANKTTLESNGKLILIGDSAGGQLVASICLVNANEKIPIPIVAQVLVNPALNLSKDNVSYATYSYFINWYLHAEDNSADIRISPLLAKTVPKLPEAIIVVGEKDEIRSDGEAYNTKLLQAGLPAVLYVQPEAGHLAEHFCAASEKAKPAIDFIVAKLKNMNLK